MHMTGTDNLSPEDRRRTMESVRSQNTTPELTVRRILLRLGYRYRLNRKDLPGRPDLVFPGRRKIVFIHGYFWHGHDYKAGNKQPKTNEAYWTRKLQRNKERDQLNYQRLAELGFCRIARLSGAKPSRSTMAHVRGRPCKWEHAVADQGAMDLVEYALSTAKNDYTS